MSIGDNVKMMSKEKNDNIEYIAITKFLDINNIRGFQLEVKNFSTFECLLAAAYIVNEIELKAPTEKDKAEVRTKFLQILNDMRNGNENFKI